MSITDEIFSGLAFPVVKVRYAGPTNYRGSRWIATCRRDSERTYRATTSYRSELSSGSVNALPAARECIAKMLADNSYSEATVDDYVVIPGELNADSYAFTFVPAYFFNTEGTN